MRDKIHYVYPDTVDQKTSCGLDRTKYNTQITTSRKSVTCKRCICSIKVMTRGEFESYCEELSEQLQDRYIKASGKQTHASDCAVNRAPTEMPRECDCDL